MLRRIKIATKSSKQMQFSVDQCLRPDNNLPAITTVTLMSVDKHGRPSPKGDIVSGESPVTTSYFVSAFSGLSLICICLFSSTFAAGNISVLFRSALVTCGISIAVGGEMPWIVIGCGSLLRHYSASFRFCVQTDQTESQSVV